MEVYLWVDTSRKNSSGKHAGNVMLDFGQTEQTKFIALNAVQIGHGSKTIPEQSGIPMVNLVYPTDEYPIPRCILVGYGREQIRRFVCYGCRLDR